MHARKRKHDKKKAQLQEEAGLSRWRDDGDGFVGRYCVTANYDAPLRTFDKGISAGIESLAGT